MDSSLLSSSAPSFKQTLESLHHFIGELLTQESLSDIDYVALKNRFNECEQSIQEEQRKRKAMREKFFNSQPSTWEETRSMSISTSLNGNLNSQPSTWEERKKERERKLDKTAEELSKKVMNSLQKTNVFMIKAKGSQTKFEGENTTARNEIYKETKNILRTFLSNNTLPNPSRGTQPVPKIVTVGILCTGAIATAVCRHIRLTSVGIPIDDITSATDCILEDIISYITYTNNLNDL